MLIKNYHDLGSWPWFAFYILWNRFLNRIYIGKHLQILSWNLFQNGDNKVSQNKFTHKNQKFPSKKLSKRKESLLSTAVASRPKRVSKRKKPCGSPALASLPTKVSKRKKLDHSTATSTLPAKVLKRKKCRRPKALGSTSAENPRDWAAFFPECSSLILILF